MNIMYKKLRLFSIIVLGIFVLNTRAVFAQSSCGTGAPGQTWDTWFNKEVEKYAKNMVAGKANQVIYTIPVIVHIVHFGEAVGTFPNIAGAQVASQIQVLNDDFNANGAGISGLPSYFAGAVGNTGLKFCLALSNPQGVVLPEFGIDRISCVVNSWQSPTTSTLDLKSYFLNTIMPNSYWDPTKYLNIWVSDRPASSKMRGFATYPSGTGLTGLFGGDFGTSTVDGIWVWASAFGTSGNVIAPYNKGRTTTHELGHWLGLRHIWGDGNCLSDYCNDTPTAKASHTDCATSTPIDQCGVGTAPYGEMPMNFMDETEDACRYMFTKDQNLRIQTAMSMCTNRNALGTHGLCTVTAPATSVAAAAQFTVANTVCLNTPFSPFNTSSGNPPPTFAWSSSPSGLFNPNAAVANPSIKFSNPGQYTLTLVATNTVNSSTYSMVITALSNSCAAPSLCLDSIKIVKAQDSLKTYLAPNSGLIAGCASGKAGYLTGTNCYKDKEFAQFCAPSTYTSVQNPQVHSVIVLFDNLGTNAANPGTGITCKIYGGTSGNGPGAPILPFGSKTYSMGAILATPITNTVGYLATPGLVPTHTAIPTSIIPFKFDFDSPVIINSTSGFFASVTAPYLSSNDSINIFSNSINNNSPDSSAWFLQYNGTWRTFRSNRQILVGYTSPANQPIYKPAKIQLAIIPQITCGPSVNLKETITAFSSNVNLMPNPSTGNVKVIFTLPNEDEINLNIYNAMGQLISGGRLNGVKSSVFDVDLSDQPNGIYFANISNGKEKVIRKIVISR